MKVKIPDGKYIQKVEVNDHDIDVTFKKRKKVALVFICLNENYWPYIKQVIEDCRSNFLPHHLVDYYVWTDIPKEDTSEFIARKNSWLPESQIEIGRRNGMQWWGKETLQGVVDFMRSQNDIHIIETDPVPWPAPTLMRYHLFLVQEEELEKYDYIFYMDADMRVVDKISDEVLGDGITAAEHPMYSLRKEYIPPYEPNPNSTAYIHRTGRIVDDGGKPRFKPYYYAGGFQGGKSKDFIKAMKVMKRNIDVDYDNNYTAIWNDESHWNKYLSVYKGPLIVLSPSYIYPDSLIKEYYEPIWGKKYEPKIITLTKPFSLSKAGGQSLNEFLGRPQTESFICQKCGEELAQPGYKIQRLLECQGRGKPHQVDMIPV